MLNIILYPVSLIPVILLYLWLRNKVLSGEAHRGIAKKVLINGFKAVIPAVVLAIIFSIVVRLFVQPKAEQSLFGSFYDAFIVAALAEELSKGYMLRRTLKKTTEKYSWLDIIIYMVIVAIGFDIIESAIYAFRSNAIQIIVRGITFAHVGLGFLMGYFAGKAIKEKKKIWFVPALIIPWVLHGTYDFCLDGNVTYDIAAVGAVALALLEIVLAIAFIFFVRKAKDNPKYTEAIELEP